jgi:ribosomal protein L17
MERSTQVAHWLERHSEHSLQDLGLATSSVPVRSILLPTNTTTGAPTTAFGGEGGLAHAASLGAKGMADIFDSSPTHHDQERQISDGGARMNLSRTTSAFGSSSELGAVGRDSLGLSRYQIRGDLKEWLQRVEALNERLVLDGGDFTAAEESFLRTALERQVAQTVHKDAIRDDYLMKQSVKGICEMLENATRTPFAIREDLSVKNQLDSLEKQVQDMYAKAARRGGFVYGTQVSVEGGAGGGNAGAKKVESEGEIRKRQLAAGVAAAAQSQHILLTQVQLNQVLQAFYQQQRPSNKREQGRLERQLVQSMVREDNITTTLRRRNKELSLEVETLQETVQQLLEEKQRARKVSLGSLVPDSTSEGSTVEGLQQTNETIKEMSEVLARKAIRDIQGHCDELRVQRNNLSVELKILKDAFEEMNTEREQLQEKVKALEDQWSKHEEAKRQQEEERNRLFGGMRSDQQYYQSTIHKVLLKSSTALASIVMCVGETDQNQRAVDWKQIQAVIDAWTSEVSFSFHFCDAAKAAAQEVRVATARHIERGPSLQPSQAAGSFPLQQQGHPQILSNVDVNHQLVNDLGQRLDDTIAEAKAKFREARFMRSFMWYLIHCFDALLNGTYSDEVHGKRSFQSAVEQKAKREDAVRRRRGRGAAVDDKSETDIVEDTFPPAAVIALDADYAYAWSEEIQALERVFMGFRSRLSTSETQQGEVNSAVLRALESVGDVRNSKVDESHVSSGGALGSIAAASSILAPPPQQQQQLRPVPNLHDAHAMVEAIAALPTASCKDVRLAQTLEDHQRLPSGARAVDVATVLLLEIKEAKGHFAGGGAERSAK